MIDCFAHNDEMDKYDFVDSILLQGKEGKKNPLFTIVIPTFNRSKYIKYALDSALAQEFDDFEIVIVENGLGTDGQTCADIIAQYSSDKIRYYRNDQNIGLCGNWNRASMLAQGKYIVMLHDDDMISCKLLTVLYGFLSKHPDVDMVGMKMQGTAYTEAFDFEDANVKNDIHKITYESLSLTDVYFGNYIGIVGMTYKRSSLIEYGGFKDKSYPNEDTIFIANVAKNGNLYRINDEYVLTAYRQLVNLSQSRETMAEIIVLMHLLRKQSATNSFLTRLANVGEKFQTNQYIDGAKKYWGIEIDEKAVMSMCDYDDDSIGFYERFCVKIASLMYRGKNKLKSRKRVL